jgi:hypothetical protein
MDVSQLRIIIPSDVEQSDKLPKSNEITKEIKEVRVLSFLQQFRDKIIQCIECITLYTPYPTISQIHKNKIRDKVNHLKSFYNHSITTHPFVISDFESQHDPISKEICTIHHTISNLLDQMNKHINVIIAKKVIVFDSSSLLYDWA